MFSIYFYIEVSSLLIVSLFRVQVAPHIDNKNALFVGNIWKSACKSVGMKLQSTKHRKMLSDIGYGSIESIVVEAQNTNFARETLREQVAR